MSKKKKLPIQLATPSIKDINFSYQKVVSYSQFSTFSQCPRKWYLQSVEKKEKQPPNINLVFGTAIHYTLQHYIKVMFEQSGAAADREDIIDIFENKYRDGYQELYDKNGKQHFSNPEEMHEFYDDGIEILNWFKKRRNEYLTTRKCHLIGIEMPLQVELKKNVIFTGYIDLVIYDEDLDKLYIIDFKTSTKGWSKYAKADDNKIAQILLYKKFFSDLYKFPIDKIEVEFLILKRKIEPSEFQQYPKRVQSFKPASGKIKTKKAAEALESFVHESFDESGSHIRKEYKQNFTKLCDYCVFNNTEHCKKIDEKSGFQNKDMA
jgi:hypothetical protein